MGDDLKTTRQAAAVLGKREYHMTYLMRCNLVQPSFRDPTGRAWLWSVSDIEAARVAMTKLRQKTA